MMAGNYEVHMESLEDQVRSLKEDKERLVRQFEEAEEVIVELRGEIEGNNRLRSRAERVEEVERTATKKQY